MQNRSLPNVEIRREMERTLILGALVAWTWPVLAADLPTNPAVTQVTIATTICVSGWTKTVRPSAWETARIKIKLIRELELPEELLTDFELDHRIPLALGGIPYGPEGGRLPAAGYALKARDPVRAFEHLPNCLPLGLAECF